MMGFQHFLGSGNKCHSRFTGQSTLSVLLAGVMLNFRFITHILVKKSLQLYSLSLYFIIFKCFSETS